MEHSSFFSTLFWGLYSFFVYIVKGLVPPFHPLQIQFCLVLFSYMYPNEVLNSNITLLASLQSLILLKFLLLFTYILHDCILYLYVTFWNLLLEPRFIYLFKIYRRYTLFTFEYLRHINFLNLRRFHGYQTAFFPSPSHPSLWNNGLYLDILFALGPNSVSNSVDITLY